MTAEKPLSAFLIQPVNIRFYESSSGALTLNNALQRTHPRRRAAEGEHCLVVSPVCSDIPRNDRFSASETAPPESRVGLSGGVSPSYAVARVGLLAVKDLRSVLPRSLHYI